MSIKKVKPNGIYKSGLYEPINPEKYIGDVHNIIFRSSWEFRFCKYCDTNENILKWSSEPLQISYGEEAEWIIEIKPEAQHKKPVLTQPETLPKVKAYNRNMQIWITNQSKFKAAREWAAKRNYNFGVVDENFLFKSS
jgi:hypothetical protein